MLQILKMIVIAAAGVALGLVATFFAVERSQDSGFGAGLWFGAVSAGPWTGWPRTGTRDADPYARALFARNGETPIGITEGLSFIARQDSKGGTLEPRCDYSVSGSTPAARFWTLSALTPDGHRLPISSKRHGFTSSELLRNIDGDFKIRIAASARSGNWLQVIADQPFVLMLRLYDTSLSANAFSVVEGAMPTILRESCR